MVKDCPHRFSTFDLPPTTRLSRLPLRLAGLYLGQGFVLRLVLWLGFGLAGQVGLAPLVAILALGALRDAAIALFLALPLTLYLVFLPPRFFDRRSQRLLFGTALFLFLFALFYLGFVEYFFFDEFNARLNLVAVDYLLFPHEVLTNIWDSYPVLPVLATVSALSLVGLWWAWPWLRRRLDELAEGPALLRSRLPAALGHLVLVVAVSMFGSLESALNFDNRIAGELAENGVRTFLRAALTSEIDYPAHYLADEPALAHRVAAEWLGRGGDPIDPATLVRQIPARVDIPPRSPNIVFVVEESLGAEFVGAYGDTRGLTPHFDRLASEGLLFEYAYATGTRTVRGLEAITASFPPIPTVSIVRRPGSEDVATIGKVLRRFGYRTLFLYGGYGYFDNMNHFFGSNGFELHDRADFPNPKFANIWGVSDEDLFAGALREFDGLAQAGQPFFGLIMTTSNHKPFTFPPGIPGVPTEGGGRLAGVRYADHALGQFFDAVKTRTWATNTLFVVVADHGARVYGADEIPLHTYAIPLLFWWPQELAPGKVASRTSQIDIAPTVLGLLGRPYAAPFFGRDVLRAAAVEPLLFFNHNHKVGLLKGEKLVVLGLKQQVEVFQLEGGAEMRQRRAEADPADVALATAFYQVADDLFHRRLYR